MKLTKECTMSVCSYSTEYIDQDFVKVDHRFIQEFAPVVPDSMLKVYLYGLYACNKDISMDEMCQALNLSPEDLESAFLYWQEMGVVTVLSSNPLDVRYLPTKYASNHLKKYNKDKYTDFNIKVQELLNGRMLTPNEYNEYYYLMEHLHFEADALLMLIAYCVQLKNNKVGYSYIVTVAKNFASDGCTTCEKMEERLALQERSTSDLKLVLATLKIKRAPSIEEYNLYLTWTEVHGLAFEIINHLAKKVKSGGMERLDQLVTKCIENKLYSTKEIDDYYNNMDMLYTTAKQVVKNLGLRYENVEPVVETYILPWINCGLDSEMLATLSNQCFRQNIRTLTGLDQMVQKLYKLGIVTLDGLSQYLEKQKKEDQGIADVLTKLGLTRPVNPIDRNFYQTWTIDWNLPTQLIEYAISLSSDKALPMQYLNKILSYYHTNNISTVEQAQKQNISFASPVKEKTKKSGIKQRQYTKEEMSNLIQNIKEIDL